MKTRLSLAILMLTGTLTATAGTATVTQPDKLREQPRAGAWSIMDLHRRATVRVLETRREWVRVEADGNRSGWVREESLSMDDPGPLVSANPARQGGGTPPVARTASRASNHALVLSLENPSAVPRQDSANATAIARLMGVPDANIRQPAGDQLDLDGLRKALAGLDARMGERDRAFIYLSGESTRLREDGRCTTGFVLPASQEVLGTTELATHLRSLASRADKLVLLTDTRPGGPECPAPEDSIARSLNDGKGNTAGNILYLAASQGGLATQALLACLDGRAPSAAAAGMPTGKELRDCAQATLSARPGKTAEHSVITLAGNGALIPALVTAPVAAVSPHALLNGLHAQRDERREVSVSGLHTSYRVAGEPIRFTLASSQPGYLHVLAASDSGFTLLYPNQAEAIGRIDRKLSITLPAQDKDSARGKTTLLFVVTDGPRNFFRAGLSRAGAFASAPADSRSLRDLPLEILGGDNSPACTRSETRNLGPSQRLLCSTSFGSALQEITETP